MARISCVYNRIFDGAIALISFIYFRSDMRTSMNGISIKRAKRPFLRQARRTCTCVRVRVYTELGEYCCQLVSNILMGLGACARSYTRVYGRAYSHCVPIRLIISLRIYAL
jgi:hypothetical protein